MEDKPEYDEKNDCFITSSSTSVPPPPSPQDEITLFLNQILLRSSTSASSSSLMSHVAKNAQNSLSSASMAAGFCSSNATLKNVQPLLLQSSILQHGISAVDSTIGVSTSTGGFFSSSGNNSWAKKKGGFGANVPMPVEVSENETNVHYCESEEGVEALVEEVPAKFVPSKSSSKRSRAAEVHNLSEKRRRSRINEKMKALQILIPNSNKTDKASMLDEAIEYLKQLQLQVQMLSMRNGLISHPVWFSEGLQLMRMEFGEDNKSKPLNRTTTLPFRQENSLRYASNLPEKFTMNDQPSLPSMSHMMNSETSFGLDSSVLAQVRTLQPRRSSELLQHQQTIATQLDTKPMQTAQRREK